MKILSTGRLFSILILIFAANVFGQGSLKGTISDSLTSEPLVGANVFLKGTALGAAVDIEGVYRITRIPAGNYTVRISFVGYKTKEVTVTIQDNKTVALDIQLISELIQGQELIVSAQALGQAAAINQQLFSSNTIVNVVSEQKIQELPDANAAESIGRLPGVSLLRSGGEANKIVMRGLSSKFSTVTIDGVRQAPTDATERGLDLSTISQGSLSGIELFKALTSDQDGDAIAGTVNLVTRKAPSERVIRVEAKGGYNGMEKSAEQYNFQGRYGQRYFDDVFGLQVTGNIERTIRSSESTLYDYDLTGINSGNDYEITEFRVTYANEIRKRGGASVLFDFNTPDSGSVRFNNVFNQTSRDYLTSYRNYHTSGGVTYDYRDRHQDISTISSALIGENYLLGFDVNWNASFSQSEVNYPLDFEMNFTESSSPTSGMKNVDGYKKGPVENWIPYAWNNFQAAYINSATERRQKNLDRNNGFKLDLSRKYTLANSITGEFKFGGKYKSKSRYNSPEQYISNYYLYSYPLTNKDGSPKALAGTRFENLQLSGGKVLFTNFLDANPDTRDIYGKYALYPLINRDALQLWRQLNLNGAVTSSQDEYFRDNQTDGDFYDIKERVYAGYAMNTFNFGQSITLIAGIRIENDDNDYGSRFTPKPLSGFPFPFGALIDTTVYHKETTVLPNFQSIIKPTDFWNIRLAAYKALARPDFDQRLLKFVAKSASGNTLDIGNTDLKNAVAWNFEIQNQFYSNTIGLFSVSAFYKDIERMYHNISGISISGQQVLDSLGVPWQQPFGTSFYTFTYPYNSTKPTKVWGFEVEHQANFRFLPGLLKNILLNYNFTVVRSETWITSSEVRSYYVTAQGPAGPIQVKKSGNFLIEKKQKLEDQPEFFGNASLGYDIDGFSFRVSVFYQGKYNKSFSSNQRDDRVQDAYTRLDLILKQKINDNISVSLNLNNLTNTQEGDLVANRITGWELPNTNIRYGMTADLGVRIDL